MGELDNTGLPTDFIAISFSITTFYTSTERTIALWTTFKTLLIDPKLVGRPRQQIFGQCLPILRFFRFFFQIEVAPTPGLLKHTPGPEQVA